MGFTVLIDIKWSHKIWLLIRILFLKQIYFNYTIPCWISMTLSWVPIELTNLFAGMLGAAQLTASATISNVYMFMYNILLGIWYAFATSIGNSLGENRPNKAKKYYHASLVVWFILAFSFIAFNYLAKEFLISLYTSSKAEETQLRHVYEIYLADIIVEIFYISGHTTLVLLGYQYQLLIAVIICEWFIMTPLSYLVPITFSWGLLGLWIVHTTSGVLLVLVNLFIQMRVNWEEAALEASKEMHLENN